MNNKLEVSMFYNHLS